MQAWQLSYSTIRPNSIHQFFMATQLQTQWAQPNADLTLQRSKESHVPVISSESTHKPRYKTVGRLGALCRCGALGSRIVFAAQAVQLA